MEARKPIKTPRGKSKELLAEKERADREKRKELLAEKERAYREKRLALVKSFLEKYKKV